MVVNMETNHEEKTLQPGFLSLAFGLARAQILLRERVSETARSPAPSAQRPILTCPTVRYIAQQKDITSVRREYPQFLPPRGKSMINSGVTLLAKCWTHPPSCGPLGCRRIINQASLTTLQELKTWLALSPGKSTSPCPQRRQGKGLDGDLSG